MLPLDIARVRTNSLKVGNSGALVLMNYEFNNNNINSSTPLLVVNAPYHFNDP